jgi:DNA-binding NtrC family response regulator
MTQKKSKEKTMQHPYNLRKAIEQFERHYLKNILQLSKGDRHIAAGMLGIHVWTLESKIKKYDIERDD